MATKKADRNPWAVEKHEKTLAGTKFAKKCAGCAGTTGKLDKEGKMGCSRANGKVTQITEAQATACDGTKPPPFKKKEGLHKPHPIFREHRQMLTNAK